MTLPRKMEKLLLCCLLLVNRGSVSSQLLDTVGNVRLVDHVPYILKFMETAVRDIEEYGWSNLKVPGYTVDVEEDVFDWHVKGRATFKNAFVVSIQKVDVLQQSVQQVWRFDNTDNTTSVFCQSTLRMVDMSLGYDIDFEIENGTHHHYTGLFKHNTVQFPFAVIYNMFTEELSATVTMSTLPRNTNKMVFAPNTGLSQVLSHQYNITSATEGLAAWATDIFQPILLEVARHKVPFPEICYNCPVTI